MIAIMTQSQYNNVITSSWTTKKVTYKKYTLENLAGIDVTEDVTAAFLPSNSILGTPLAAADGRVATCHTFTYDDIAYLESFGATMYDRLPADFMLPTSEP